MESKHCTVCHGYCPSGTLPNGLCTDCQQFRDAEPVRAHRRAMAVELIRRHPDWASDIRSIHAEIEREENHGR